MKKSWHLTIALFILTLSFHFGISAWQYNNVTNKWAQIQGTPYLQMYLNRQEYFLGLSYALAAGFTLFSFLIMFKNRKKGVAGVIGGTTLMTVIYCGSCFLIGCCGSPMLTVYLSLFGASFLGFTKPIIFLVTLISIVFSYYFLQKKSKCDCSEKECR